jgi:pilus assembly protein CpaF
MTALSNSASPQVDMVRVLDYMTESISRQLSSTPPAPGTYENTVRQLIAKSYEKTKLRLDDAGKAQLFKQVNDVFMGYGPIQPLLDDPTVSEVMVNGPNNIFVERDGKLVKTEARFNDEAHVRQVIDRIIIPLNRRIDMNTPTVDARLPDGSRVNAVIPPVAIDGSTLTIRKFSGEKLGVDDLIAFGSLTEKMADFLKACVVSRLNIVISGGTGSGKTTLLNVLSSFIPEDERIVTIEDAAELQLQQDNLVRLETKAPDRAGEGEISIRDLVRNSLRMRPDRVVVGECRGGEALDMLQAMNTGHDGSLTTLHANNPRDALSRLETMTLMSGIDFPLKVVREQIASAVDLIVQQSRMKDGSRMVTHISEVAGLEGPTIVMTDLFRLEGGEEDGSKGELQPTGMRPMFGPRLEAYGFKLGADIFAPTTGTKFRTELKDTRRRRR